MKITEAIAAEHATLLKWFNELEGVLARLTSRADVCALASLVEAVLGNHNDSENEFLLGPLDRVIRRTGYLAKHSREHHELGRQLGEVRRAATCAEACRRLRSALRASREHFRQEEQSLFPVLERVLSPRALDRLGRRFSASRQSETSLTDRPVQEVPAYRESVPGLVATQPGRFAVPSAHRLHRPISVATPAGPTRKAVFRIIAPEARRVLLVGDFTEWHQRSIPLKRTRLGDWTTTVKLTPGRHKYRFLVDGKWRDDPGCNLRVPNAFQDRDLVQQVV